MQLKGLLARQSRLNAALDVDKSDAQAAAATTEPGIENSGTLPQRVSHTRSTAKLPASPDTLIPGERKDLMRIVVTGVKGVCLTC